MSLAQSDILVREILAMHLGEGADASASDDSWQTVARWLGVDSLLDQSFAELSQGQQRLLLIAAALGSPHYFPKQCDGRQHQLQCNLQSASRF